jgi:pimeloyl-[acyl-carrier protein] synthase
VQSSDQASIVGEKYANIYIFLWKDTSAGYNIKRQESFGRKRGLRDAACSIARDIRLLFARRRQALGTDLLSQLLVAHDQEDSLSESELIVTATTLLIAGHETTVNLIGNGMYSLLLQPEQLTLLRQRSDLMPSAIEELSRFESSSQMASRYATEDIEVGGTTIQRGQIVNLLLGSGNHDPEAFSDPDRLNITRKENRHLAFGTGIHYCLGAPLARLEGQVAIGLLLQHLPNLRLLDSAPQWRDTIGFRGLQRLDVTWGG